MAEQELYANRVAQTEPWLEMIEDISEGMKQDAPYKQATAAGKKSKRRKFRFIAQTAGNLQIRWFQECIDEIAVQLPVEIECTPPVQDFADVFWKRSSKGFSNWYSKYESVSFRARAKWDDDLEAQIRAFESLDMRFSAFALRSMAELERGNVEEDCRRAELVKARILSQHMIVEELLKESEAKLILQPMTKKLALQMFDVFLETNKGNVRAVLQEDRDVEMEDAQLGNGK